MNTLNITLFNLINGLAFKNTFLDRVMIIFSMYAPETFMLELAALYLYGVFKNDSRARCIALDTFVITVINLLLSFAIGLVWFVPRPFVTGKVKLLFTHVPDASFPSDHAIGTMSIAMGINNYSRVIGAVVILLSCLVGISRVYVGNHYPLDVLGGYLIVLVVSELYYKLLKHKVHSLYLKVENALLKKYIYGRL